MSSRIPLLTSKALHVFATLACAVTFAATGCSVYDAGALEDARPGGGAAAGSGAAESGCEARDGGDCRVGQLADAERSACDASAADGCTHAAWLRWDAHEPPASLEAMQPAQDGADECPDDPHKRLPGTCGCGTADTDTDLDGTADCEDGCPHDEHKTAAGICGCGASDSDEDGDGTPDCLDACPRDRHKTAVGMCGCGSADNDEDGDGMADCIDECPSDPSRTTAGRLGCGPFALLHRYPFDGSGAEVRDVIGHAPGMLAEACGSSQKGGAVQLAGDIGAGSSGECYVSLPVAAWPNTVSATFEAWITWNGQASSGSAAWQRVFDFGNQSSDKGLTYLCVMPQGKDNVRAEFSIESDEHQVYIEGAQPLAQNVIKHVAVVVDEQPSMTLYVDGVSQGSVGLPATLTSIVPANLWLGRSSFVRDPAYFGSLHEFRIYGVALNAAQIQKTFEAGPDYAPAP